MQYLYSVSEFHILLKLGIWEGGSVDFWGQVDIIPDGSDYFFRVNRDSDLSTLYTSSSLIRMHLGLGVYLLDLFYIGRDTSSGINIYRLIVAVCRNDLTHQEALYQIRVSNPLPMRDFFAALRMGDRVSGSRFRKKSPFHRPGSIQTKMKPAWPKFIFRR